MADALRGSMDAAEYKHVVLGLIFLKYISDAFEEQHAKLEAEKANGGFIEAGDVAEAVLFMVTRPRNVTIRDLVILPQRFDLLAPRSRLAGRVAMFEPGVAGLGCRDSRRPVLRLGLGTPRLWVGRGAQPADQISCSWSWS